MGAFAFGQTKQLNQKRSKKVQHHIRKAKKNKKTHTGTYPTRKTPHNKVKDENEPS